MSTEKERMLSGQLYDANDPELVQARIDAQIACRDLNQSDPRDVARRRVLVDAIFGRAVDAIVTPPFHCDYGKNVTLGSNVYFNFNCVILDVAPVLIGSNTLFGPGVQILTATHPIDAAERRTGREYGKSVTIGDDVWVGGGAIICPGVTIGSGSVIGAGSVVTRDIPAGVLAAGNPCRVIRSLA